MQINEKKYSRRNECGVKVSNIAFAQLYIFRKLEPTGFLAREIHRLD